MKEQAVFAEYLDFQYNDCKMKYDIVRSVELSRNLKRVYFVMDMNANVMVLDKTLRRLSFYKKHTASSLCMKYLWRAEGLLSLSADHTVNLWKTSTMKNTVKFKCFKSQVCYAVFDSRQRRAVILDHSGNLAIVDLVSRKVLKTFPKLSFSLWLSTTFDFDFERDVAICKVEGDRKSFLTFHSRLGKLHWWKTRKDVKEVSGIIALTKLNLLAICVKFGIDLFQSRSCKRVALSRRNPYTSCKIQCVAKSQSERYLFTGSSNGSLGVFDVYKGLFLYVFTDASAEFMIRLMPDQMHLAMSGQKTKKAAIWELSSLLRLGQHALSKLTCEKAKKINHLDVCKYRLRAFKRDIIRKKFLLFQKGKQISEIDKMDSLNKGCNNWLIPKISLSL